MKRIKLNLALVAMVLGCTLAFAFKAPVKTASANQAWAYVSGTETNPNSYTAGQPPCDPGSANICYIEAPSNGASPAKPVINPALASRITNRDGSLSDVFLKH
jgi:hypothetical protein